MIGMERRKYIIRTESWIFGGIRKKVHSVYVMPSEAVLYQEYGNSRKKYQLQSDGARRLLMTDKDRKPLVKLQYILIQLSFNVSFNIMCNENCIPCGCMVVNWQSGISCCAAKMVDSILLLKHIVSFIRFQ